MKIDVKSRPTLIERDKPLRAWDQLEKPIHKTLRQLLRPLLFILAVAGCYTYDKDVIQTGKETSKGRPYRLMGAIYRTLVLLNNLLLCVRSCTRFSTLPASYVPLSTLVVGWYVLVTLSFLISSKSNYVKYGNQRKVFDFWDDEIRPMLDELEIEFPEDKIKFRLKIYLFVAISFCIFNITGITLLATDTFSEGFRLFFSAPFTESTAVVALSCFMVAVATLAWIMPILYITIISTVLILTFEAFNDFLEKHISQNSCMISCQFQKIRQLHLNLSKVVSDLDKDFGYYFAMAIVLKVSIATYILYMIIKTSMGIFNMVMFLFWLIAILVLLGVVTVFAAFVNSAAHGALDSVYYICVKGISTEQLGQLNLFLSKLTGTQIGFTTLGLITITKEFLLTIAGVFITYFFLLYTL